MHVDEDAPLGRPELRYDLSAHEIGEYSNNKGLLIKTRSGRQNHKYPDSLVDAVRNAGVIAEVHDLPGCHLRIRQTELTWFMVTIPIYPVVSGKC